MELKDGSQLQKPDENCIIQPDILLAFDNVDQHTAAGNLRVEPAYKGQQPSSNQTIVVQVTCNNN